ncbi:unnamed protein product [Amaranthus hypochondriacus]
MFSKAQCFDISSFFQSPCHLHTSFTIKFSVSPLESYYSSKKFKDSNLPEIPNKGFKKFRRIEKQNINPSVVVDTKQSCFSKNPLGSVNELNKLHCRKNFDQHSKNGVLESEDGIRNFPAKKLHTKCSTKWASYGGCIPSILQALKTTTDLDEAF